MSNEYAAVASHERLNPRSIATAYWWALEYAPILQSFLLLLFRLRWGLDLYVTGKGKLLNHAEVAGFFASLGIPAPSFNAWFVSGVEIVGGVCLLLGFCSRPAALFVSGCMLTAYLTVSHDREALLNAITDTQAFVQAEPFFFLLTALLVLAFGPGLFSIDALIKRKLLTNAN